MKGLDLGFLSIGVASGDPEEKPLPQAPNMAATQKKIYFVHAQRNSPPPPSVSLLHASEQSSASRIAPGVQRKPCLPTCGGGGRGKPNLPPFLITPHPREKRKSGSFMSHGQVWLSFALGVVAVRPPSKWSGGEGVCCGAPRQSSAGLTLCIPNLPNGFVVSAFSEKRGGGGSPPAELQACKECCGGYCPLVNPFLPTPLFHR